MQPRRVQREVLLHRRRAQPDRPAARLGEAEVVDRLALLAVERHRRRLQPQRPEDGEVEGDRPPDVAAREVDVRETREHQATSTMTGLWSERSPRSGSSRAPCGCIPRTSTWSTQLPPAWTQPGRRGITEVEVAAEHERRVARPGQGARRGPRRVRPREQLRPDLRVEVRHPDAVREAHGVHDAALRPPAQVLRTVLGDRLPADEDRVAAAGPGLHELGPPPAHPAQRRDPVARRPDRACARRRRDAEARRPSREDLLQQRDVPVPSGDRRREVAEEVAAARLHRAAVKEVPRQHPHRGGTLPACPATSSPAAS